MREGATILAGVDMALDELKEVDPVFHSRVPLKLVLLLVFALFPACAHRAPTCVPDNGELSCQTDSDCTIATEGGCCSCSVQPYAVNRAAAEKKIEVCAVVDCRCVSDCATACRPTSDPTKFLAVCEQGTCTRQIRPQVR